MSAKGRIQTNNRVAVIRRGILALAIGLCTSAAYGEVDLWPADQKDSFRRHGEPPQLEAKKLFGLPVAETLAALKAPLELLHTRSPFGWREKARGKKKFHYGVDYSAPRGTPILATGEGVVEALGKRRGFGNFVKLRHEHNVETVYGHLTSFMSELRRGSVVQAGDVIGYVGSTGRATGPHLHYEVLIDGIPVNPEQAFHESASHELASQ